MGTFTGRLATVYLLVHQNKQVQFLLHDKIVMQSSQ
jgi:hypothetical protein